MARPRAARHVLPWGDAFHDDVLALLCRAGVRLGIDPAVALEKRPLHIIIQKPGVKWLSGTAK